MTPFWGYTRSVQEGEKLPARSDAPPRREVLGTRIDIVSEADVLRRVKLAVRERVVIRIATVNVEYVMLARSLPAFAVVLSYADIATPDSAGILWALRRQGVSLSRRVGGSDLLWSISRHASNVGHSIFLLGGAAGVAKAAADALAAAFPTLHIAGYYSGSPDTQFDADITNLVRRSGADILFVAFGAPNQDFWLERNLASTGACVGLGVGGSLDYAAGATRRAPPWMREHGMEWMWRLFLQPSRWRRMLALPRFVMAVLVDGTPGPNERNNA